MGFELDLTKGANEGEISLHLVGSYYGDPDQFPAIIQPFLDSMVRPAHRAITLRGQRFICPIAQPDIACTCQRNLVAGQSDYFGWWLASKYASKCRHRRQPILRKESLDAFGLPDVTRGHYCHGKLDVIRRMVH